MHLQFWVNGCVILCYVTDESQNERDVTTSAAASAQDLMECAPYQTANRKKQTLRFQRPQLFFFFTQRNLDAP